MANIASPDLPSGYDQRVTLARRLLSWRNEQLSPAASASTEKISTGGGKGDIVTGQNKEWRLDLERCDGQLHCGDGFVEAGPTSLLKEDLGIP